MLKSARRRRFTIEESETRIASLPLLSCFAAEAALTLPRPSVPHRPPPFPQSAHTKAEYEEYGPNICRTNAVFRGI